jgi:hypothetical protein
MWVLVAGLLIGSEIGVRRLLHGTANDQHLREIPEIASRLRQANGVRILFLGNSLTRTNLNLRTFVEEVTAEHPARIQAESVYPDDSKVAEWYYTFKHYFVDTGSRPEILVVSFAARQLEDTGALDPARFATAFGGYENKDELFRDEITGFGDRVEFYLASVSAAFAHRERVKDRLLAAVIPHYKQTALRVNRALRDAKPASGGKPSYRRLGKLIALASKDRIRVILVSMPQPIPYPVNEGLLAFARERGVDYHDGRFVEGLTGSHFVDGYHLGAEGAKVFSRALAGRMSGLVQSASNAPAVLAREGF